MNEHQHVASVRSLFDQWAQAGRAEGMQHSHTPAARQAFERLAVQPGQHYLDIGCGNGYSVRWAAEIDATVRPLRREHGQP
ncbi:MAG: class I SAM-dependent methyltransferase [Myxococcales bacterium]|nr:class I SAM-dependent methyltransferase [Myxococcales bacterium]